MDLSRRHSLLELFEQKGHTTHSLITLNLFGERRTFPRGVKIYLEDLGNAYPLLPNTMTKISFSFFSSFTILVYPTLHYYDSTQDHPSLLFCINTRIQAIYSRLKYRVKQTSAGVYSQKDTVNTKLIYGHLPRTVQTPLLMSLGDQR